MADLDLLWVGLTVGSFMAGPVGWILGRHGSNIGAAFDPNWDLPADSPQSFSVKVGPSARTQPTFLGPDGRRHPMAAYRDVQAAHRAQLDAKAIESTT